MKQGHIKNNLWCHACKCLNALVSYILLYPVVSHLQMQKCRLDLRSLAWQPFLPLTPAPYPPHHKMRVRYQTQWWFSWQLGWRGGKKLFLSAEDFKSFWLGCILVGVTFQKYHTIIDVNCSLCRWSKLSRFFPLLCLTGRRSATECCDRWGWTMASGLWDSLSSKREQNEEASSSEIRIKIPHIQIVSTAEVIKVLTYSRHIDRSVFTLTYLT